MGVRRRSLSTGFARTRRGSATSFTTLEDGTLISWSVVEHALEQERDDAGGAAAVLARAETAELAVELVALEAGQYGWMCRLVDAGALGAVGFQRVRKAQLLP